MQDNYRQRGLRKILTEELRNKGIRDEIVLSAIEKIPRHFFLDSALQELAYKDMALQIGEGQTISQPYTVAKQSELLQTQKGHKVLEIGTGSGYQAAILLEIGVRLYSVERHLTLHQKAQKILDFFGFAPKLIHGDGYKGLPGYAPFDRIIVTAAAPEIPETLLNQLKVGGILVIPVNDQEKSEHQIMKTIYKVSENNFEEHIHGNFRFVPMLPDKKS
jgi:protein-L-isoaspartate(D-aspartate) O-methyltransferase